MKSTRNIFRSDINKDNFSLRQIIEGNEYYDKSQSLLELIARHDIRVEHERVDAKETRLGPIRSDLVRSDNNKFTQNFFGGRIDFLDFKTEPNKEFKSFVNYVGFKCFGTTDGPGSDEPYMIISVYNPYDKNQTLKTTRIPQGEPYDEVDEGTERADPVTIWSGVPGRLQVFTILMEHDNGPPEEVEKAVHDKLKEHLDQAAAAGAAVSAGFGLPIPEGVLRDVLGVLSLGISSLAGNLFGDSKIGTDSFPLTSEEMFRIASAPFPTKIIGNNNKWSHETLLISGSGASYKVYYHVLTKPDPSPLGE
jgi:hypothetical protein